MPVKTTAEAINEATAQLLSESSDYYVIGEGVPDPKAAFSTTKGLADQFPGRVFDMPVSENAMTGVCIGSAIAGMRPIMVHMRADFLLYAADQIINNAAKWHRMFGGRGGSVPMVIRAVIGRGWGNGPQHSQHLEALFSQIPGLKVVCPSNAYDAKGMLIKAARDNNPVLFLEHRWIHELKSEVPDEMYEVDWNQPHFILDGEFHLFSWGYMVHECIKASEFLRKQGHHVGVVDLRRPGECHAWDGIVIKEDSGCPPAPSLSKYFYPSITSIMLQAASYRGFSVDLKEAREYQESRPHDVPNLDFRGPF